MEIEEAVALLSAHCGEIKNTIQVPVTEAVGMVTCEDVVSDIMVPPFPKSAMDGYAVRGEETIGADREHPMVLQVLGELCAGDYEEYRYRPGSAVRVMTGAYVPEGFDAVIRQEDTDYGEETVQIYKEASAFSNYCKVGEDICAGEVVIPKNTRLSPVHIGILASIGKAGVKVYERLRVSIVSTGTELTEAGSSLAPGKIYNSISYLLAAAVRQKGFVVCRTETCADEEKLLTEKLKEAVKESHIVITTGAVSVGKKDIIPKVLADMGAEKLFQGVDIQPGTPTMASVYQGKIILSLSGNPYAALANFECYFWPMAAKLQHNASFDSVQDTVVLDCEYAKVNKHRRLIRAKAEQGRVWIPSQTHASSVLHNLTECNCMIDLEAGRAVKRGDTVRIRYLNAY